MPTITRREYEGMLTCVARLHECDDVEQFPRVVLTEIPRLVGADHVTFNYVAPSVPRVAVLGSPDLTGEQHAEREQVFAEYLSDQPILRHYLATGDASAHKLSDFLSVRAYHSLPLYKHLYHDLRYEDQFAFLLFPPGSEMIAVALARDRRTFTERDRRVLNLLRPHVARAYRQAERLSLLQRRLERDAPEHHAARVTTIVLDAGNRPTHFGEHARQWINRFFPEARAGSRLPPAVQEWLRRGNEAVQPGARADRILVRQRDGERLRIALFPGHADSARTLVLGLETASGHARTMLRGKLTPREIDVLIQLEQGKSNQEIAAALGISPLTVRTHLEHIFEKLHVLSRTGAVTQFRHLC